MRKTQIIIINRLDSDTNDQKVEKPKYLED